MQILSNPISALNVRKSPKFSRPLEIRVEVNDCDVRFNSENGNMAVSCMRDASGHNYSNSPFTVDLAMVQIPRDVPQNVFLVIYPIAIAFCMGQIIQEAPLPRRAQRVRHA